MTVPMKVQFSVKRSLFFLLIIDIFFKATLRTLPCFLQALQPPSLASAGHPMGQQVVILHKGQYLIAGSRQNIRQSSAVGHTDQLVVITTTKKLLQFSGFKEFIKGIPFGSGGNVMRYLLETVAWKQPHCAVSPRNYYLLYLDCKGVCTLAKFFEVQECIE